MRYLAVFAVFSTCLCPAQSTSPAQSDPFHNEPLVWEHYDTVVHMHPDGTGDRTVHITARLQSEGAVREFSVIQVSYAAAYDSGIIDYVRVHKPDGTTVETPVADAIEMPSPVTATAPLYSDLKQKQLPVRSLATGDVIEYQLRTVRNKAEVPGQFWGSEHFLRDAGVVLSETFTLEVPAGMNVQIWDPNHPVSAKEHDHLRTYVWTTSQLTPTKAANGTADKVNDPDEDADGRKLPSIAWTTFHSWAEVGDWYRGLALSRSGPTPSITSRANELTRDAKTPEEQIRALYDFVSRTRYIGIDFGVGRYQPHFAEEVMANQYGDCKDKDTLFEALLRAKGFNTAPALIGVGIAPVDGLPSPAFFNHVITTVALPSGRVWLDTTPEVAPYRVLIPLIRDQQALVIPPTGTASLERTPADPPYPYFERFEAAGALDKDGLLKSHVEITLRSDNEIGYRILVQRAAPAQWDEAMQSVSRAMGFAGTVSNAELRQKDPAGPVRISYDYTRSSFADWDHHRILPLFPPLEVATIDKEKAPEHDIDQGWPRKLEAITRITLPPGYSATPPADVHVRRDYATFEQTYRIEKDVLTISRTVVILKRKIPKASWKDYNDYAKAAGFEEGENYISLAAPNQPLPSSDKIQQARTQMMQGSWDQARQTLLGIKAEDPKTPYLMSMLGVLAQHDRNPQEAISDYETELSNHPENAAAFLHQLASLYISQKRYQDAETLLRKYLDRDVPGIYLQLAHAQKLAGDANGGVATLRDALAKHPDAPDLENALAQALMEANQNAEAVALIKPFLARTSDALALNNNSYLLAEMKQELPLAETSSRHAIELLQAKLDSVHPEGALDDNFRQCNTMTAAWDTLGWTLFEQGKPVEAEPYIRAAWLYRPSVTLGNHLGQVLEALRKPSAALTIYELALASDLPGHESTDKSEVKSNIERLQKAGAKSSVRNPALALQDMRTFHVPKPKTTTGSATLRIVVDENGITETALLAGPPSLEPVRKNLQQIKMPNALPKDSKAHLLHDGLLYCSAGVTTCEFVLSPHVFSRNISVP
jgi:tetratricopeptide (TPR) repeat protein